MNIIYVSGVARSGTSWLSQIFNSAPDVLFRFQPFFSYEFKNRVNEDSSCEEYESLFNDMIKCNTSFLTQRKKQMSGEYPCFEKSSEIHHLVFKENRYQSFLEPMLRKVPTLKAVGLIRHPCAVLNSWKNNEKEFPAGADLMKEWRFGNCKNVGNEDYFGFYKWKEVANLYLDLLQKFPDRFFLLRYENIVHSPVDIVMQVFDFLKIDFTESTLNFLKKSTNMHQESYYSVYKKPTVANKWKKDFPEYITSEIEADLIGTRLEKFLFFQENAVSK